MPNHFLTVGLCGNPECKDIEQFESLNGMNLCEVLRPLPDDLQYIIASQPRKRYRHRKTGELLADCNGPELNDRDQYAEEILTPEQSERLIAQHGADNWFDWQCENWGTKWGTYLTKVYAMGGDCLPILVEFQSAWMPPSPKMMRAITDYLRNYGLHPIRWIGHDPSGGDVVEIEVEPELATLD